MTDRPSPQAWPPTPDQEPWNQPAEPASGAACRRAAAWLWGVAAAQLLLTACCFLTILGFAVTPADEIRRTLADHDMQPHQVEQVMRFHPYAATFALGYGLLGLLPAALLAGLAFGVRKAGKWSILTGQVILLMQMIVVGWFMLMGIAAAMSVGQPGQFTLILIVLGTLLAVLGMTFRHLWIARRQALHETDARG